MISETKFEKLFSSPLFRYRVANPNDHPVRGFALVLQAAGGTAYWDPEYRSEGDWEALLQEPGHGAALRRFRDPADVRGRG